MKKPLLGTLVFAGVFICGAVVGGAVSIHYYERFVRDKGAERFFEREIRGELAEELQLTREQKDELRAIVRRSQPEQRAARKQIEGALDRMVLDLEAVLTPEQRAILKEHRAQQKKLREQRDQQRGRSGSSQGPDGRPPSLFMERRDRERPPGGAPRPEKSVPPLEPPPEPSAGGPKTEP